MGCAVSVSEIFRYLATFASKGESLEKPSGGITVLDTRKNSFEWV